MISQKNMVDPGQRSMKRAKEKRKRGGGEKKRETEETAIGNGRSVKGYLRQREPDFARVQRGRQKWQKYYRQRNINSANYNVKSRGGNRERKPRLINSGEGARFVFVPLNSSLEERSRPLCYEIARARMVTL